MLSALQCNSVTKPHNQEHRAHRKSRFNSGALFHPHHHQKEKEMASLNKVMLIGNLGADPEVRSTPNGSQVATFRVACTESWKDQSGQRQERTEWVTVVAWKKQAEIAQKFLRKGSRVYVEGKLQTRTWDDKATGAKRYATEVLCDHFIMLDGVPKDGAKPSADTPHRDDPGSFSDIPEDDLPF